VSATGKRRSRVVYDSEKKGRPINGDETGKEVSERSSGEFPPCLPAAWAKGFPPTTNSNSVKLECECGKHTLYGARFPPEVWRENPAERVRVVEKG